MDSREHDDVEILRPQELESFWLSFANDTVQVRGGHSRDEDDVLLLWTAPRRLSWIRLLAVGVQNQGADTAPHAFELYRDVGECVSVSSGPRPGRPRYAVFLCFSVLCFYVYCLRYWAHSMGP